MTLPTTVTDYRVTPKSPTDELITLGQIFTEVGGYASTILSKENLTLAKYCGRRLSKINKELQSRHASSATASVSATANSRVGVWPATPTEHRPLASLSISELHTLYCQRPQRQKERVEQGREPLTYWFERHIVEELSRRTPATTGEQLKIDYCRLTYQNDLENLASILDLPIRPHKTPSVSALSPVGAWPATPTEHRPIDTPTDLLIRIETYKHYADVTTRERLIETVDHALDLILPATNLQPFLALISEIMEIGRKGILTVPAELPLLLAQGIQSWKTSPRLPETEIVLPLLTLSLHTGDPSHERHAQRIIRRSWRHCLTILKEIESPSQTLLDHLFIATYCSDYIPRFSPRRALRLLTQIISSLKNTSSSSPQSAQRFVEGDFTSLRHHRLHLISSELSQLQEITPNYL